MKNLFLYFTHSIVGLSANDSAMATVKVESLCLIFEEKGQIIGQNSLFI